MTANHYFEQQALAYDAHRNRGFLGWLRKSETRAVLSFLRPQQGERILDAGCGEGHYALLAKRAGASAFGVDVSPAMITRLQTRGIPGKATSLEKLHLPQRFDKIVCAGVLEFTQNPGLALQRLAQHLKPRGKLIILYSRPSLGTFTYVLLHKLLHHISLHIIPYRRLQTLLNAADMTLVRHRVLPFFGGIALAERK